MYQLSTRLNLRKQRRERCRWLKLWWAVALGHFAVEESNKFWERLSNHSLREHSQ